MARSCHSENDVSVLKKLRFLCCYFWRAWIFAAYVYFLFLCINKLRIVAWPKIFIRYCSWWDLRFDWGLLEPGQLLLRSNMKFSRAFYYWAIISNFILRCSWGLALSPNVGTSNDLVLFLLQMAEIFRRVQWFIIRVEWESRSNMSSAFPLVLKTRFTVQISRSSHVSWLICTPYLCRTDSPLEFGCQIVVDINNFTFEWSSQSHRCTHHVTCCCNSSLCDFLCVSASICVLIHKKNPNSKRHPT